MWKLRELMNNFWRQRRHFLDTPKICNIWYQTVHSKKNYAQQGKILMHKKNVFIFGGESISDYTDDLIIREPCISIFSSELLKSQKKNTCVAYWWGRNLTWKFHCENILKKNCRDLLSHIKPGYWWWWWQTNFLAKLKIQIVFEFPTE